MGIFNEASMVERAMLNGTPGAPPTVGELISSGFDQARFAETSVAAEFALSEAYDRQIDRIYNLTGKRLFNPMDPVNPPRQAVVDHFSKELLPRQGNLIKQPEREEIFAGAANRLGINIPSTEQLRRNSRTISRIAEQRFEDVSERTGAGGGFLQFIGAAGGIISDPPILVSMLVGAPAATSILRAMLIEGAIGGVSEAFIQTKVQPFRASIDLPHGLKRGLLNVAAATVAGAGFAGIIRGGISGTKALLKRSRRKRDLNASQKVAKDYMERVDQLEESNPFPDNLRGETEHVERMSAAQRSLQETPEEPRAFDDEIPELGEEPVRLSDEPASPVRPEVRATTQTAEDTGIPEELRPIYEEAQKVREALLEEASDVEDIKLIKETAEDLLRTEPGLAEETVRALNKPEPKPSGTTLMSFLAKAGGLIDEGGELASIGIKPGAKGVPPGFINRALSAEELAEGKIQRGLTLDQAGELLSEPDSGFKHIFDNERPSIPQILEKLDEDFNVKKVLPEHEQAALDEHIATTFGHEQTADRFLDLGIDIRKMHPAEVRIHLEEIAKIEPEPRPRADVAAASPSRLVGQTAEQLDEQGAFLDEVLEQDVREAFGATADTAEIRRVPDAPGHYEGKGHVIVRRDAGEVGPKTEWSVYRGTFEQHLADETDWIVTLPTLKAAKAFVEENAPTGAAVSRLGDEIWFGEGEDFQRMTAREVFEEIDEEKRLLDEWEKCLTARVTPDAPF